ncbi:hypothetical protein FOA52_000038 [Chlamydomonas sp. UWO 241]|nr:hypothetical protein FOA52_000038 [Chlamydomonas sp. UWO 241]
MSKGEEPKVVVLLQKDKEKDIDPGGGEDHEEVKEFVHATGYSSEEAAALLAQWGRNELEEKTIPSWLIYLQMLYQPMPIMIWIAAIIEAAIQNWADFGILMAIQFINATLGWYETTKAGNAVAALKARFAADRGQMITIVSAYSPTEAASDEEAGDFYLRVAALADKANDKRDLLIVAGGSQRRAWDSSQLRRPAVRREFNLQLSDRFGLLEAVPPEGADAQAQYDAMAAAIREVATNHLAPRGSRRRRGWQFTLSQRTLRLMDARQRAHTAWLRSKSAAAKRERNRANRAADAAVQRDRERWIGQQVAEAQDMLRKKNLRQFARACDRLAGRSRSHQIPPAMRDVSGALHSGPDGVLKAMTESFDKLYGGETKLSDETLNQLENDVAAFELTRATEVDEAHGRPPDLAETEACASLKPLATCKRDGKWASMDAAVLVPGDLILLASGSAVPADCLVNHGTIDVDQSALTGESLPVTMHRGMSAKMGSMVVRGEVEGTVEFTGNNTFFGKTASMLQQDQGMGHLQKMLLRIILVLVGLSFVLCFTCFGYLLGTGVSFKEAIQFTVVLLVASIPIAIEIVCTTTLALGSRQMSAMGAIVTRLAAIEDLAGMNMLCSDKTGTLTLNKMAIQQETPTFEAGIDQHPSDKTGALTLNKMAIQQ